MKIILSFTFLLMLLTAGTLKAQDDDSQSQDASPVVTVTMKDRDTLRSEVSHMSGHIQLNQSEFELDYNTKAFGKLPVSLWFSYQHMEIQENLSVALPSHLEGRTFGIGTKFPLIFDTTDQYFVGLDIMPSWYTDDWTWTSSAMRVPFRTYLIYKPSEQFLLILGATIRPDYDNVIVPVIGFNYQPNDKLDIHLASSEPTISYKLTGHWSLFAEYSGALDEYEVTRQSQKGVVFKVREALIGAGIGYRIQKFLQASISTGINTSRRFSYKDNVGKVDADPAPYFKARLNFNF